MDELIKSIKQLELDLSIYREFGKDTKELNALHFAVSDYLTTSDNRD